MNKIAYISKNKIYVLEDGKSREIPCGRIEQYKKALDDIKRKNEWKNSGTDAKFMGGFPYDFDESAFAEIGGIAVYGDKLVYGVSLDSSGSIYIRSLDPEDNLEELVFSGNIHPGRMNCRGKKLVVSLKESGKNEHISVYELGTSDSREYTDGDSTDVTPVFADDDKIYFSTAGIARDQYGQIAAVQNMSIACLDTKALSIDEVVSDERYDYLSPTACEGGSLYCIRRPKGGENGNGDITFKDIIMFPYRIFKAFLGLLNMFSIIFGGESLKSGGDSPKSGGNAKAKQMDPRYAFMDANVANAEKNMKNEERKGEKYPGIMSPESILVHIGADGNETIVRRGVLDYLPLSDGNIAVSNGRYILITDKNGKEISAFRADSAVSICEFKS